MPRKKLTEEEKRKRKWDRRFKKAADKVRAKHGDKVLNEKWTYKASKNLFFKAHGNGVFEYNPLAFYTDNEIREIIE